MRRLEFSIGFLMFVAAIYAWVVVPHPLDAPVAGVLSWFGGIFAFSRKDWIGRLRSRLLGRSHGPDEVTHLDEALRHLFESTDQNIREWAPDGHRRQAVYHIRAQLRSVKGWREPQNPAEVSSTTTEEGSE